MPAKALKYFPLTMMAAFLFFVARAWGNTWDDSGITLAFARNLAKYGDLVSTPLTGRVEGYSTFLWMILNAGFFRLGLGPNIVVGLAKILATGIAILNIFLFWQLLNRFIQTPFYRYVALGLFALSPITLSAAVDGMETSLYCFLVLTAFMLYPKRAQSLANWLGFATASSLIILIRHEGPLFLLPFVAATLFQNPKSFFRQKFLYGWPSIFLIYHAWHFLTFGELLTNPMLAKRFWPYHPNPTTLLQFALYYLTPLIELIQQNWFAFLFSAGFFLFKKSRHENILIPISPERTLINFLALMGIFVILITGSNFGAALRLSYPAYPFILLFLFFTFDEPARLQHSRILQGWAGFSLVVQLAVTLPALQISLPKEISLAGVEELASTVSAVQAASGQAKITYAGADMGGLLLYHGDNKRVIDLGLLCDRELAKNGYKNYEAYIFETEKPEIIEAHSLWLEPLLKSPSFPKMYQPVLVKTLRREQILYLRNDFIAQIESKYQFDRVALHFTTPQTPTKQALDLFGYHLVLDLRNNPTPAFQ